MSLMRRFLLAATTFLALGVGARSEVILQYFETDWSEIYKRTPEIAEIGYDAIWFPSPAKSPVAGTIKWANVGYSLYDRFDLGDVPQRGSVATRYGNRGELRNMVDHLHFSDVKIYPDIVFNHNGNGPDYRAYPGMKPNDFHVWQDSSQPGGWKRASRMSSYDDISGGYGYTFQQELVSLFDIFTEPDRRFVDGYSKFAAEPAPFVRHPGQYDKYPYNKEGDTLPSENVRQMLGRWAAWLGNEIDYDGFRLDAGKHVVREFYGGPGSGFLNDAQWNFDQRRGYTWDQNVPDLYKNDVRRKDMLMFNEIFTGSSSTLDYWRGGNVKMRYLDFPAKQGFIGSAFSGNLAALGSLGAALDPAEGVAFVQSHDQPAPDKLDLAYAWLLTKVGVPIVYFSGNNISWSDKNSGKTWVLPGTGNALGDYNSKIQTLVWISNQFARGREWNRWKDDADFFAYERYTDVNGNSSIDSGESTLLVALNDSGWDQTKTLATAFPNGTVLKDYTGNQSGTVTVSNGQVTITVPGMSGQGYVCYAPYVADGPATGEALRFSSGGTPVGTMNWVVPGGRDVAAKARTIPRIIGDSVDIEVYYSDPTGGAVSNTLIKWGQGRNLNASATDYTGDDVISGGFEQASYDSGKGIWKLTADLTGVPEGLHTVKARLFNGRAAGLPALYQTFAKTVYVDRHGPDLTIESPTASSTVGGDVVAVIKNPDRTASRVEYSIDGGLTWADAVQAVQGTWKASLSGLTNGGKTLQVRATENDNGATPAPINSGSNASQSFTVATPTAAFSISHAENATINLPFFTTTLTVPAGTALSQVKLYWDGYEMTGLTLNGTTVSHVFNGGYTSGGVEQRLSGAFVNGPHFFEARLTSGGQTRTITRKVTFNLYGQNLTDSDGDGLPDDVELPTFTTGGYATKAFPGDGNEDTIPNNGENWTNTNPLNEDTNYNGTWDGDEDWDGDGVSNLTEVRRGFQDYGNAFYYNIYSAASKPADSVASSATWTLGSNGTDNTLAITYSPNNGSLNAVSQVYVVVNVDGVSSGALQMTNAGSGKWTYTYTLPSGAKTATLTFQNANGSTTDSATAWSNFNVVYTAPSFVTDGTLDSANYEVAANNGMKLWAARKGTKLYVATWSSQGSANDHFLYVANNFGNPETNMQWSKAGNCNFWFEGWPWLAGESGSSYCELNHGGTSGRVAMGSSGNVLEAEIDLVETFGSIPKVVYLTVAAYGDNDGSGLAKDANGNAKTVPVRWVQDGNDINITDMLPVNTDSIADENKDGYFDGGQPVMSTVVNGNEQDANYNIRRFYLDELMQDKGEITVRFKPNTKPGDLISNVEVFTNLNRRDFAVLEEDPLTVNTDGINAAGSSTYYRAYQMTGPDGSGNYTASLPVTRCGVYRLQVRYKVNGNQKYYTDNAQRRDLSVVVSPKKAQQLTMYEVNPTIVEARGANEYDRSTFADLVTTGGHQDSFGNTWPDVLNKGHFESLNVNMLWLQPIHPIGAEGQTFSPGSPYAVKDYWSVNPALGRAMTPESALAEFKTFVSKLDEWGVGVMMDGTFNHSAPDAIMGKGAEILFGYNANSPIRDVKPSWFSKEGNFALPASTAAEVAVAPDRNDFGKWTDVRDFYFGVYDTLVKYASLSHRKEFLLERDAIEPLASQTKELWEYFAYYPTYWLEQTGHPRGTPKAQSYKGIDGLRCDFAQGLPSQFWEYCINKTRSVKWDFIFMAESLDGFNEVGATSTTSKRHGVGYRSSRQFDVLNENVVFYWRGDFFNYPFNVEGGSTTPAIPGTFNTFTAYDSRRQAFDNVMLLNDLVCHDEVLPHNDPYRVLYAYSQMAALDGVPMIFYGQEGGLQNSATAYNSISATSFSSIDSKRNFSNYETNFGKVIPNFKSWNCMTNLWANRDWNLQGLYGRINRARLNSPALKGQNVYFLSTTNGSYSDQIVGIARQQDGTNSAGQQQVVFAFVNNNPTNSTNNRVEATFKVNVTNSSGANWFGIEASKSYNIRDLLSTNTNAQTYVWPSSKLGSEILSQGINVLLPYDKEDNRQAQYLQLVDQSFGAYPDLDGDGLADATDPDVDNDGMSNAYEIANGLDPRDANGVNGRDADKDGDGYGNYVEYLADTGASDKASSLMVTELLPGSQTVQLTWKSVAGRIYRVRYSIDLKTWSDYPGGLIWADNASTSVQAVAPQGQTYTKLFFTVALVP